MPVPYRGIDDGDCRVCREPIGRAQLLTVESQLVLAELTETFVAIRSDMCDRCIMQDARNTVVEDRLDAAGLRIDGRGNVEVFNAANGVRVCRIDGFFVDR